MLDLRICFGFVVDRRGGASPPLMEDVFASSRSKMMGDFKSYLGWRPCSTIKDNFDKRYHLY